LAAKKDTTPPTVPTNLVATAVSSSQINLSWSASTDPVIRGRTTSGLAGYKVYRGLTQIATVTSTSFSDFGLSASTTYNYQVSAYDNAGNNSAQSNSANATTNPAPDTTPPVISNLTVNQPSSTSTVVFISWATDEPADDQIEYGLDTSYGQESYLSTFLTTSHNRYLFELAPNTLYHFRVKSRDAAGNLAVSEDNTFTTNP